MGENVTQLNEAGAQDQFFTKMFGPQKGYVYSPITEPGNASQSETWFFKWPEEKDDLIHHTLEKRVDKEVYFSPILFKDKILSRDDCKGTYHLWVEFNGSLPKDDEKQKVPTPSFKVRTSKSGHEYWFWTLEFFESDLDVIHDCLKRLAWALKADLTAWHYENVFRPPHTTHHRYEPKRNTSITENSSIRHSIQVFRELPEAPKYLDEANFQIIPDALEILVTKARFNKEELDFFLKKEIPRGKRYLALTRLAFLGIEKNLEDAEILSLLWKADERWKHFSDFKPEMRKNRLIGLIRHCRAKKPRMVSNGTNRKYKGYRYLDLLNSDFKLNWLIDDLIEERGMVAIVGKSGTGKTRWTMKLACHIALGKDFLRWKVNKPMKVQFWALEMNEPAFKKFLAENDEVYTDEERKLLHENFMCFPINESIHVQNKETRAEFLQEVDDFDPDVIIIDSWGAAVQDNLNDANVTNPILNFINTEIRNTPREICVIWIHHLRKSLDEEPTKDDIHGSNYFLAQQSSVIALYRVKKDAKHGDILRVKNLKNRLAEEFAEFKVHSDYGGEGYTFIPQAGLPQKGISADEVKQLDKKDVEI